MTYAGEEQTSLSLKRQRAEQAIKLAMESRWEEAVAANRALLSLFPSDVEAYNRLGRALLELGRYADAREAYRKALEIDPLNVIARKNLNRLSTLKEEAAKPGVGQSKLDPHLFIEETGKTGITTLKNPDSEALARMTAGNQVLLRPKGKTLAVENARGEHLGEVDAKLSLRLISLMEGGNQYAAAVSSLQREPQIIIKEIYQHPSQAGKLSFPPTAGEAFRPYIKEGLLKYDLDEEELVEDEESEEEEEQEGKEEWHGETEATGGDVRLYDFQKAEAAAEDDDNEFEE